MEGIMTPEEFEKRMQEIENKYIGDLEARHGEMDDLMCEVLRSLKYCAGVNIFENSEKWYA